MKRAFIFSLLSLFAIILSFAKSFSFYYDGYWGNWDRTQSVRFNGNYSGFVCYWDGSSWQDHPSQWFFRFQINNYIEPTKKEKKQHLKKNIWYEYTGTVEYYISDEYQDIKSVLKSSNTPIYRFVRPSTHRVEKGEMPCVKRTAQARIKIAPYKDHPKVYNIWFENVGVAIDLEDTYFRL